MKRPLRGTVCLLMGTIIWGFSFIAQSVGMEKIGPFTFQTLRCALAVVVLIPTAFLFDGGRCSFGASCKKWADPQLWRSGLICGCALFAAASLQQIGLVYTDAGKAGFLTAMYIVLVPVIGLFFGKKVTKTTVFSVALGVVGLYLLSCVGVSRISLGDLSLMACALAFAVQITCIDRFGTAVDGLRLNCIQCLVVTVLSLPFALLTETVDWHSIASSWVSWGYAGVLTMGVAYSLQILGQKHLEPTTASLIMSLESVFAALGGWLILQERMTPWELLGSCLMFLAVILSQLPQIIAHRKG